MQVRIFAYDFCIYGMNIVENSCQTASVSHTHTHQPQQKKNAPQTDCVADKVVS